MGDTGRGIVLCIQIQQAVRKEAKEQGDEQIPVSTCTFTHGRKLYLYPGIDMRTSNHPESVVNATLPVNPRNLLTNWRGMYIYPMRKFALLCNL